MAYQINIKLQVQGVSGLDQVSRQINDATRGAQASVKVAVDPASLRDLKSLNDQLGRLGKGLADFHGAVGNAQSSLARVGKAAGEAAAGMASLRKAASDAGASAATVAKAVSDGGTAFERYGNLIGLAAKRFAAFTVGAGAIYTFVRGVREGLTEAVSFERQMLRLAQVSDSNAGSIKDVEREITRLSTSFGVSSKDLGQAAVTLKQVGITTSEVKKNLESLALAALAPNFDSMAQTTEGAIAVMRQFKTDADGTKQALGAMNAVAADFAVEAGDLVEVVRRAGGAFKQTGGELNELLGLFTAVRSTTRESAESIATGLRTVFSRLQRSETVSALRELGVNLRYTSEEAARLNNANLTNQFVGAYEAVKRLSEGLTGLRQTDPRYAAIIEELGGYRQISRVIPLITEFKEAQRAVNAAQTGAVSLYASQEKGQDTLVKKTDQLKESFLSLFRSIEGSDGFQSFAKNALDLATSLTKVLQYVQPLVPLLTTLATIKLVTNLSGIFAGGRNLYNQVVGPQARHQGGLIHRFSTGGVVPGVGDTDSVPAYLEPGEYVLRKQAARNIGYDTLAKMNRGGPVRLAGGGWSRLGSGPSWRGMNPLYYPEAGVENFTADEVLSFDKRGRSILRSLAADSDLNLAQYDASFGPASTHVRGAYADRNHDGYASVNDFGDAYRPGSTRIGVHPRQFIRQPEFLRYTLAHELGHAVGFALGAVPAPGRTSHYDKTHDENIGRLPPALREAVARHATLLSGTEQFVRNSKHFVGRSGNDYMLGGHEVLADALAFGLTGLSRVTDYRTGLPSGLDALPSGFADQHKFIKNDVFSAVRGRLGRYDRSRPYALGGFAGLAGGGLPVLPKGGRADRDALLAQIEEAYKGQYDWRVEHAKKLLLSSLTPEVASRVPAGAGFLGSGLVGTALGLPEGDVLRLQSRRGNKIARQLVADQVAGLVEGQRRSGPLSESYYGTKRPDIRGLLQPTFRGVFGAGSDRVLAERLPFVAQALFADKAQERGALERMGALMRSQGYEFTDAHAGNLGVLDGKHVIIDPGAIARIKRKVPLPAEFGPTNLEVPTNLVRRAGGGGVDSVKALLTPGEYVLNKDAVSRLGLAAVERMNVTGDASHVQKFQRGGFVRMASGRQAKLDEAAQAAGFDRAVYPNKLQEGDPVLAQLRILVEQKIIPPLEKLSTVFVKAGDKFEAQVNTVKQGQGGKDLVLAQTRGLTDQQKELYAKNIGLADRAGRRFSSRGVDAENVAHDTLFATAASFSGKEEDFKQAFNLAFKRNLIDARRRQRGEDADPAVASDEAVSRKFEAQRNAERREALAEEQRPRAAGAAARRPEAGPSGGGVSRPPDVVPPPPPGGPPGVPPGSPGDKPDKPSESDLIARLRQERDRLGPKKFQKLLGKEYKDAFPGGITDFNRAVLLQDQELAAARPAGDFTVPEAGPAPYKEVTQEKLKRIARVPNYAGPGARPPTPDPVEGFLTGRRDLSRRPSRPFDLTQPIVLDPEEDAYDFKANRYQLADGEAARRIKYERRNVERKARLARRPAGLGVGSEDDVYDLNPVAAGPFERKPLPPPPYDVPPDPAVAAERARLQATAFRARLGSKGIDLSSFGAEVDARTARQVDGRGGVNLVSRQTQGEIAQAELSAATKELTAGIKRQLQTLHPTISSTEALRKAQELAEDAVKTQAAVVRSGNRVAGRADLAQQLLDERKNPLGSPSFFGRIGDGFGTAGRGFLAARQRFIERGQATLGGPLTQGLGYSSLLALPYLSAGFDKQAGTAEEAVATSRPNNFTVNKGLAGGLQGAVVGGTFGAAVAGPYGAAIGAAVGGIVGFAGSVKEAEQEIRAARIGAALQVFSDRLQAVANFGLLASPDAYGEGLKQIQEARAATTEKNLEGSRSLFGFGALNVGEFVGKQGLSDKRDFAQFLGPATQALQRQIYDEVKRNPGLKQDQVLGRITGGANSGLNNELIKIIADSRQVSRGTVLDDLKKSVADSFRQARAEEAAVKARQVDERTINAFGRLNLSLQQASDSLLGFRQEADAITDLFAGAVGGGKVTVGALNAAEFGRNDGVVTDVARTVAGYGGEQGVRLSQAVAQTDKIAQILPAVLTRAGAKNPATGADFETEVKRLLVEQLGNNDQALAAINTVTKNLAELGKGERGAEPFLKELSVDVTAFAEKLIGTVADPLKQALQKAAALIEQNANEYVAGLTSFRQKLVAAQDSFDKVGQFQVAALRGREEVAADREGRRSDPLGRLTLAQLQSADKRRQENLAGFRGPAAEDPEFLGAVLRNANSRALDLTQERQRALDTGNKPLFDAVSLELLKTSDRASRLGQALENLTKVSERSAAIQEKLSAIKADRDSRLSLGEKYFGGSLEERGQIERGTVLANIANKRGNLDGFVPADQALILNTLRGFGKSKLTGFDDQPIASDLIEKLVKNSAGGMVDLDKGRQGEKADLEGQLVDVLDKATNAQAEIAKTQGKLQQDFFTNLQQSQEHFLTKLEQSLTRDRLTQAKVNLGDVTAKNAGLSQLADKKKDLASIGITSQAQIDSLKDDGALAKFQQTYLERKRQLETADKARKAVDEVDIDQVLGEDVFKKNFYSFGGKRIDTDKAAKKLKAVLKDKFGLNEEQSKTVTAESLEASRFTTLQYIQEAGAPVLKDQKFNKAAFRRSVLNAVSEAKGTPLADSRAELERQKQLLLDRKLDPSQVIRRIDQSPNGIAEALGAFDGKNANFNTLDDEIKTTAKSMSSLTDTVNGLNGALGGQAAAPRAPLQFASGGDVKTHPGGPRGTDVIPAWLSSGEYIVNARSSKANKPLLDAINSSGSPLSLSRGGVAYLAGGGAAEDKEETGYLKNFYLDLFRQRLEQRKTPKEKQDYVKEAYGYFGLTGSNARDALRTAGNRNYSKLGEVSRAYLQALGEVVKEQEKDNDKKAADTAREINQLFLRPEKTPPQTPDQAQAAFTESLGKARAEVATFLANNRSVTEALGGSLPDQNPNDVLNDIKATKAAYSYLSPRQKAYLTAYREAQAGAIYAREAEVAKLAVNEKGNLAQGKGVAGPLSDVDQAVLVEHFRLQYTARIQSEVAAMRGDYNALSAYWGRGARFTDPAYQDNVKKNPQVFSPEERGYSEAILEEYNKWLPLKADLEARAKAAQVDAQREQGVAAAAKEEKAQEAMANKELGFRALQDPFGASGLTLRRQQLLQQVGAAGLNPDEAAAVAEQGIQLEANQASFNNLALRSALANQGDPGAAFGLGRADRGTQLGIYDKSLQLQQQQRNQAVQKDLVQARFRQRQQQRNPQNVRLFADGGLVPHYLSGGGGVDTVPAYLSEGEYVLRKGAVDQIGVARLDQVNRSAQGFATGGLVGKAEGAGVSPEVARAFELFNTAAQALAAPLSSFSDGAGALAKSLQGFTQTAAELATALRQFPESVSLNANHQVSVTITGAEAIGSLSGELKSIVEEKVKGVVRKVFKEYLPEANTDIN